MTEEELRKAEAKEEEEIIFRSQLQPAPIPSDLSLPQFVLQHVDDYPDSIAIVDAASDKQFTHAQVRSLCFNVAVGLIKHFNIQKGDVVCLLLPNMPEYPILVFGILTAGGVFTGANTSSHPQELEKQIKHSEAKLVITDTHSFAKVKHLVNQVPIAIISSDNPPEGTANARVLFDTDATFVTLPQVSQEDLCALPFSSGTTGISKGVMITHRNLIANLCSTLFDLDKVNPGENVTLGLMPFFHIYGFTGICCSTLRTKGKVVVLAKFELRLFLDALIKHEVRFAPIVPPIILALVKSPVVDEYDLSKLKLLGVMSAAAPLAPDLQEGFEEKFPGVVIQEAYGLTEHSCITLSHCAPDHPRGIAKKGSVGFILPNLEVKFVDTQTGKSMPRNSLGELCVRSQCVTKGYYKNPEATNSTIDERGWLHTGDVGYIDDDGDIFIVERIKELIKYKGFQVPPAELEAILISNPEINDAAVVPMPDEEAGEIPAACVVLAPGSLLTKEDVINFVASKVASYKKVRLVDFVDTIPKTAAGKILRRNVKQELLKRLVRPTGDANINIKP
ncbi:hypothetical protein GOP47_0007953 [Adiantum capillus-veneris]|uniref:4-coumarate--CoA ligase n=1 Tax=Adiantum capillus-veneris TaxID=13818 RepID=A0A9D4V122_ADICA|nr:hypothetical protein GOP47_0007453 [Adiantum capillus-veneris]KAI5078129.1 hypothetical protein GOP47_0007953 [Adiantum capillus-veneris]